MSVTGNGTTSKVSITESSSRPRQKLPDGRGDLVAMRLESEMPRLEERDPRVLDVSLESLRARRHEERIFLAPDRQEWRLVLAKVLLERWIHLDVARVVEEQV